MNRDRRGPYAGFVFHGMAWRFVLLFFCPCEIGLGDIEKVDKFFVENGFTSPLQAVGLRKIQMERKGVRCVFWFYMPCIIHLVSQQICIQEL